MQTLSEAYANLLLSNKFIENQIPLIKFVIGGYQITKADNFNINRQFGTLAQQCTITIPNVNYEDPTDTGFYNAQRNHSAHNKPATPYLGIIEPGIEFYVNAGYGDDDTEDTVRIFTGNVDTVKISMSGAGDSTMTIIARGKSGKLVDRTIKKYNTSTSITNYFMTYPVEANIQTYYLTSATTNPYLYQIWKDACMRAGFATGDVDYTTYSGNLCTVRLNDIKGESFVNVSGNWIQLAEKIVDLMYYTTGGVTYNFFHYEDENGKLYLAIDNNFAYQGDDDLTLTDSNWATLTDSDAWGYRAIKDSIVANAGVYVRDVDYEYDMAKNAVRRKTDSSIPSGYDVNFTYTFCAWTFHPNQIFSIEQWVSHDEIFGTLVGYNEENNVRWSIETGALGDGTTVSVDKAQKTVLTELNTTTLLNNYLLQKKLEMKKDYYNLNCNVVGIPHLRIRDTICFLLYGTATAIYKIMGYTLAYDASSGFDMSVVTRFYQNSGAS